VCIKSALLWDVLFCDTFVAVYCHNCQGYLIMVDNVAIGNCGMCLLQRLTASSSFVMQILALVLNVALQQ
jgi:hypothetical protein